MCRNSKRRAKCTRTVTTYSGNIASSWLRQREAKEYLVELSNGLTKAFDPSNRVELSVASYPWMALDGLMAHGADFEKERARNRASVEQGPKRFKKKPLRETDPW